MSNHGLRGLFWVHKTASVTGALKSLHDRAKSDLHDIWMPETRKEAEAAFDLFIETYGIKYERVVGKLVKDRGELVLLRLPCRALEAHPGHQSGRERLLDGQEPHTENQGMLQPQDRPHHGLQADDVSREELAEAFGIKPPSRDYRGD